MTAFDEVVDEYDEGRPGYPPEVFAALGPLHRRVVLEGGAGTGIATRELQRLGAWVVPFDVGPAVLRRAVRHSPGLPAVLADGASLPFRDGCADLLCFAQAWHWLNPGRRCAESARVLRPGGRWAGWWSHARADGEYWFDRYWAVIESATAARRTQRDTDWGNELVKSGRFEVNERVTVPWTRDLTVATFLAEVASYSYVASLDATDRDQLLAAVQDIIGTAFPSGEMHIALETWLWTARTGVI